MSRAVATVVAVALALAGCARESGRSPETKGDSSSVPAAASVAAPAPSASSKPVGGGVPDVIPEADDALEKSSVQITKKNYKEELDRLEKENL